MPEPTVGRALAAATDRLRRAGTPTPRLDAEVLLAHAAGRDRTWVLANPDASLNEAVAYDALVGRRAAGEPVAYLRGFKEWHSLRIRTDARALIPRPETELLLEAAVEEIALRLDAGGHPVAAWEIGTGSGAVAVGLALRFRDELTEGRLRVIATDTSPDALELAFENLAAQGVASSVRLARVDLLDPAALDLPRPDVVVANLPYVSSAEVDSGVGSLAHEPRLALDGGVDGLDLVRRLCADLPARAAAGASVLLEIGAGQAAAVRALVPAGASVSTLPDLAGIERVVRIELADWSA